MLKHKRIGRKRSHAVGFLAIAWAGTLLVTAAPDDEKKAPAIVENGGFEDVQEVPASRVRGWTLAEDRRGPAEWTLSGAYPGTLSVLEKGAPEGSRFIHLKAKPKRAAHLSQKCPRLQAGLPYRVSVRYRGGPVEIKVYEYDWKGKLFADRAFMRSKAATDGAWALAEDICTISLRAGQVWLAVTVPAGKEADMDDLRVEIAPPQEDGRLNVRDCGASGSRYEATATTTAGSNVIEADAPGDFRVGQQVAIAQCNPHIRDMRIWEPKSASDTKREAPEGVVEARGYDGSLGNWTVYILELDGTDPLTFRWSDDMKLTWKGNHVPVTGDWQKLSGGAEVRFGKHDWKAGYVVTFSGRDQLVSTIEKIDENVMTLRDPTPVGVKEATVQHTDTAALRAAFGRAVAEERNIFIPKGWYRLTGPVVLNNANGTIVEGENAELTVFDISNGAGSCIQVRGGTSVTIRNLRFRGHSGFDERKQMGSLGFRTKSAVWGFYLKHCNAIGIRSPERLMVENCHATGMSAECFYSGSRSRSGNNDPASYTKAITYWHCTVEDCARNAFNNNDMAENTSVLYCRIQNVGGCTWEGASRFVKFVGNYVRNAGTVAIGNIGSRSEAFDVLPSGQHIVAHNTFEQEMVYGGAAVRTCSGATPVIVSNNIFVNFNTTAIDVNGRGGARHLPSANTIVTGNAIDLTCVRGNSRSRTGISISADDTTISDNQIYVRGDVDPLVTAISLRGPARNIVIHDNIIRGCQSGIVASTTAASVAEVIDARTFRSRGGIPWPRRRTHCYRGWRVVWTSGTSALLGPKIAAFDADEGVFRLAEDADLKTGARFELYCPQGLHWSIHHNVLTNCRQPVRFDVFGGPTAMFADNQLSRGEVDLVKIAAEIRGIFKITDNQFAGFDGPDSVALLLHPDRFGKPSRLICRDNLFAGCTTPIAEGGKGVWQAVIKGGNVFGDKVEASSRDNPAVAVRTRIPKKREAAVLAAVRAAAPPTIDGKLDDWSWGEAAPIARLNRDHQGAPVGGWSAQCRAVYDKEALYFAVRVNLSGKSKAEAGDKVEWSFRSVDAKQPTPIFVLVGSADGNIQSLTAMGATANQAARVQEESTYKAKQTEGGWVCEWRVPWKALGVSPTNPPRDWRMNLGVMAGAGGSWLAWVPTGGRICDVDMAGELRLEE